MTESRQGVGGFLLHLAEFQVEGEVVDGLVRYDLSPADGALRLTAIPSGVAATELAGWPATPPHWIHLPECFKFLATNLEASGLRAGWLRHSREIGRWELGEHPGQAWLAHVRAVLCEAFTDE